MPTTVLDGNAPSYAANQARGNTGAQTTEPAATATTAATAGAMSSADTAAAASATATIDQTLSSLGLGAMTPWATSLAYSLAGQGIDNTDIINTIASQMNNPLDANGNVDQGALAAFNAAMPGFNQLIANTGQNGTPNGTPQQALAAYVGYKAQVQQFATQAGLLPGTISAQDIGTLWANQVATPEVSQRITLAVNDATAMPQQVQDYLADNYNMTPGALVSYYLNPQNTLQQIQSNVNASVVGGASSISGFDKDLSTANAQTLAAFLASESQGTQTQVGGVNQVSIGSATSAFESSLGSNLAGGSLGSASQLAQGGYLSTLPGQSSDGTVTQDTLVKAITGDAGALAATAQASQARTAGAKGGGGATTTAEGAVGLGFANS